MKTFFILASLLLSQFHFISTAHAGAWVKPKGHGELVLNALYFNSDAFFDRQGNKQSQPEFRKYELNPYAEYGLTDRLTIGANLFLHQLEQDSSFGGAQENFGLADSELFARYELLSFDADTLSLQPLIKLPSLYGDEATPRAGSRNADAELSALGGINYQLFGQTHYAELRLGYRHRLHDDLEDQLKLDLKTGLRISEKWQFIPAIYSIWAVNGSGEPGFTEDGQNNYHLVKLEGTMRFDISPAWYAQGGMFYHVYGRNVGNGTGGSLSLGFVF